MNIKEYERIAETTFQQILDKIENCFFINVGANDGKQLDPLYTTAIKNNWSGVLVEPGPVFEELKDNYKQSPNISFENSAIVEVDNEVELYCGETNLHSTLSLNQANYMFGKTTDVIMVPGISFKTLIAKYNISNVDVLLIDVEGYDFKLLKTFPFELIKPSIIRCEYTHIWNENGTLDDMINFLSNQGYKCYIDENNTDVIGIQAKAEYFKNKEGYMELNGEIELLKEYLAKINKLDEFEKFVSRKNKPQLKDVTIVTGLWDLKRNDLTGWAHRSFETYKENFFKLLKADIPMCIYIPRELEAEVRSIRSKHNTRIYIKEAEEFKTYFPFFDKLQEIRTSDEWVNRASWLPDSPQAKLELYNPMVMTKAFMVNDAAILNPFNTKHFYWIDGGLAATVSPGYFEDGDVFRNIPTAYEDSIVHLAFPYDPHTEVHGFERKEFYKQCNVKDGETLEISRGGFWGGPRELIHRFNSEYYTTLSSTIERGHLGTEECIYTILAYKFPELIERFKIASDGLVWPFFEAMTNVTEFIKNKPKRPVTATTAKTNLYVLGFNSPGQFEKLCKSIEKNSPELLVKTRKILINNSTDTTLFAKYDELCKLFNFEEIHFEDNIGICGGRQYVAEHFHESDADFYIFLEDDLVMNEETKQMCKTGFRQHVPNLYDAAVRIMLNDKFDYLKLCFSEFYSSNNVQCSWYNVPQSVRTKVWPHYDKLPEMGFDPNCPLTELKSINTLNGLAYATGQVYYSNWPMIVSRDGNYKMFIENKFSHPFEQTWMSQMFQDTINGKLNPAIILATPFIHERTEFYKDGQRKEN